MKEVLLPTCILLDDISIYHSICACEKDGIVLGWYKEILICST